MYHKLGLGCTEDQRRSHDHHRPYMVVKPCHSWLFSGFTIQKFQCKYFIFVLQLFNKYYGNMIHVSSEYNDWICWIRNGLIVITYTMIEIGGLRHTVIEWLTFVRLSRLYCIFRHLKLELLTQFPASNDQKYLYFIKIGIFEIELFD